MTTTVRTSADRRKGLSRPARLAWAGAWLVASAVYVAVALGRWHRWETSGYDLGIFDQAIRGYSRFRAPISSIKGVDYHLLGDHFHPIIALAAPLYWIWDDPRVLQLLQVGLVLVASLITARIASRRMGPHWAQLFGLAFMMAWPMQWLISFDFHEIAFGLPIVMAMYDALDRRSAAGALGFGTLLLLVREDMGLVLVGVGLAMILSRTMKTVGAVLMVQGAVGLLVVTRLAIPYFNADGGFDYWQYPSLGPDLGSALRTIVTRPLYTVEQFFTPDIKLLALAVLLIPLLAYPLLSWYLLPALLILGSRFYASRLELWQPWFHYDAIVWCLLTWAALDVVGRFNGRGREIAGRLLAIAMLVSIPVTMSVMPHRSPVSLVFDQAWWEVSQRVRDLEKAVALIPPDVCVVADTFVIPRLTKTNSVSRNFEQLPRPDYLVVDHTNAGRFPFNDSAKLVPQAQDLGFTRVATFGKVEVWRSPPQPARAMCVPFYRR